MNCLESLNALIENYDVTFSMGYSRALRSDVLHITAKDKTKTSEHEVSFKGKVFKDEDIQGALFALKERLCDS